MKILPKRLLFFVALTLTFFLPNRVSACSCAEVTPCEAFGQASAVFIGVVLGGTEKIGERIVKGQKLSYEAGMVRFSVEEAFKGINTTEIEIGVPSMIGTSCGPYGLARGEKYLIYAYSDSSGRLSTGTCSGNKTIEYAEKDLSFLRNLPAPGIGGRIYGIVAVDSGGREHPPMAGVSVVITDEHQDRFETVTDIKGHYEFTGLKPGNYTVEPTLPAHYSVYSPKREVKVSDRGCIETNYWVNIDSYISGRVVDSTGRPVPASLHLTSLDDKNLSFFGLAYANGEFEIDGIRPGRYLLYLNLKDKEEAEPYFYPGVSDKDKAEIIEVDLGQKQTLRDFYLPPRIRTHAVSGTVIYPDGRPAANVRVSIFRDEESTSYQPASLLPPVRTDAEGRFVLRGFKGNKYKVEARDADVKVILEKRKPSYSEPLKITLDKDIENLKLVLSLTEPPENRRIPRKKTPEEKRQ